MLLIYRFMLPHATDTLFPKHRTLAPAILVGTVQLVWPSAMMTIIRAHAHQVLFRESLMEEEAEVHATMLKGNLDIQLSMNLHE